MTILNFFLYGLFSIIDNEHVHLPIQSIMMTTIHERLHLHINFGTDELRWLSLFALSQILLLVSLYFDKLSKWWGEWSPIVLNCQFDGDSASYGNLVEIASTCVIRVMTLLALLESMVLWSTMDKLVRILNCVVIYGDFLLYVILEPTKLKLHFTHVVRVVGVRGCIVLVAWALAKLFVDSNKWLGAKQ